MKGSDSLGIRPFFLKRHLDMAKQIPRTLETWLGFMCEKCEIIHIFANPLSHDIEE